MPPERPPSRRPAADRSRRRLLRGLAATGSAAVVGTAGCLDRGGETGSEDDGDTGPDDGDAGSDDGDDAGSDDRVHGVGESATLDPSESLFIDTAHVTVTSVTVQRSLVIHHLWRTLYEPDEGQLLVVRATADVEGDDSPGGPGDLRFAATLDDETVSEGADVVDIDGPVAGLNVGRIDAEEGTVRLVDGHEPRWRVPDEALERLAAVPEFHLHDAAVVGEEGDYGLELRIENPGGRDGTFRGIVVSDYLADYDEEFTVRVPAGETVTETVRTGVTTDWGDDEFTHDVTPGTRRFAVGHA